jgi:hypothetical protein
VQVINFVAKGTIEEGMLSVLAFKRPCWRTYRDESAGVTASPSPMCPVAAQRSRMRGRFNIHAVRFAS